MSDKKPEIFNCTVPSLSADRCAGVFYSVVGSHFRGFPCIDTHCRGDEFEEAPKLWNGIVGGVAIDPWRHFPRLFIVTQAAESACLKC
jgi:hypothetical protein